MPIIEPRDTTLKRLKGLHLWHSGLSSCSQRVRITLAEKGLDWQSHPVDLSRMEHATPQYQAINPKGLVPALVDNGVLLIESCDIIEYLDQTYAEPALQPDNAATQAEMKRWLDSAAAAQADLKILSHEFLFRYKGTMTAQELERFSRDHQNPDLVAFKRVYQSTEGFGRETLDGAVTRTDEGFYKLNAGLAGQAWLLGRSLTLADIAWMPNVHRMDLMGWPLERYAHILSWFEQVKSRLSFQSGLVDWEPEGIRSTFAEYSRRRTRASTHVRDFGSLAGGRRG